MQRLGVKSLLDTEYCNAEEITSFDQLFNLDFDTDLAIRYGFEIIKGRIMQKKSDKVLVNILIDQVWVMPDSFKNGSCVFRLI